MTSHKTITVAALGLAMILTAPASASQISLGDAFEDGEANQHIGDTTNSPTEILFTYQSMAGETMASLTISGIPPDATFFVGGSGPSDEVPVVAGSLTLTPQEVASGMFLLPGDNDSDVDIPLTFVATWELVIMGNVIDTGMETSMACR